MQLRKYKKRFARILSKNIRKKYQSNTNELTKISFMFKRKKITNEFNFLENKKFILFIGNPLIKYKNFDLVNKILSKIPDFKLVIVTEISLKRFKHKLSEINLEKIIVLKKISDKNLNLLYNSAYCLFYLSLYEGFGMPIIEAMMSGCPVISIDGSSISELIKDYPIKIKSENAESQIINIFKRLENIDFKSEVINSGLKISRNYTWDKCTENTIKLYNDYI